MRIEVVWIGPAGATVKGYEVTAPCTVDEALRLAAMDADFAQAGLGSATVGLFGRIVSRDELLADADRIEIYRGAAVDPKLARRARARSSTR